MPLRDLFPKDYFDGNPYEGVDPVDAYKRVRWGNEPSEVFEIEGPEDMVTLGTLAQVITDQGTIKYTEEDAPFLAIGLETNRVYIVPVGSVQSIPDGDYVELAEVRQIDYYSDKGGEEAYYYHEHEKPFPRLYVEESSGVGVIEPAEMDDGSRSYAVGDEGIIG